MLTDDFTPIEFNFDDLNLNFSLENYLVETPTNTNIASRVPTVPAHLNRVFMGCFAIIPRKLLNYGAFKLWKNSADPATTAEIANIMKCYILNNYDFITTAPASKDRDPSNYCCHKLCEELSRQTNIPFLQCFKQRTKKRTHGIFSSLAQEPVNFLDDVWFQRKTVLFIDDMITSRTTAINCSKALFDRKCHVDGLIFSYW